MELRSNLILFNSIINRIYKQFKININFIILLYKIYLYN